MPKLALQANLCYTGGIKLLWPGGAGNTPSREYYLDERRTMNILPPHAQKGNLPRTPGVYVILNTANNHRYIGSTTNLYKRYDTHCRDLKKRQHKNRHLQSAVDLYGIAAFTFGVLELVEQEHDLLLREQHYLDTLAPEYNLSPTAGNTLGVKFSEEARAKMRHARSQWQPSPESIAKGAATRTGRKMPPEFGQAISARQKGRTFSDESRAKMSAARKGKPRPREEVEKSARSRTGLKPSPEAVEKMAAKHRGMKRSPEARARMSEGQKGRPPISDETRRKISEAGRGRVISEEARRKSSEKQKGRVMSAETRQKMSESAKRRRQRERDAKNNSE